MSDKWIVRWTAIILAVMIAVLTKFALNEAACQRHGYLTASTWPTVTYCIKRVNQTDIVVRLDSLERTK